MRWFTNIKTQSKLLLVFAFIILVSAIALGWNISNALYLQEQVSQIQQEAQGLADSAGAQVSFLKQGVATKNYMLSGDTYYQDEYAGYGNQIEQYTHLALSSADTVDKRSDLDALSQSRGDYDLAVTQAEAAALSPTELVSSTLVSLNQNADDIAFQVGDQFDSITYKHVLALQAQAEQATRHTQTTVIMGIISLVALSALMIVAALVTNQVAEPMSHLTNAIVAFESNTFKPDLLQGYLKRRDEMGQLARALGAMANSITESVRVKDQFLNAAQRFIPNQYLDFLEKKSITDVKLGDHVSAEMAVMFSDVRGFTTLSERMTPQQNFDFVNEYLKLVSPVIQKHDGFIVKFLGDGMMAIFPYGVDDAVQAGIEKQQKVKEFNAVLAQRGLPPISVGIGIHTGHMMVGMIGEEMRMQGDAFSDNVNLTSRVEGLNKFYGTSMIITEETLMRLEKPIPYRMRYLGKVQVKGRDKPIALYEVYEGAPPEVAAIKEQTRADYERGLKLYMAGKFAEAKSCFEAVLQRAPDDATAALYLEHSTAMIGQAVPEGWDGVEVMTSK
jgi:class 3 adenylate cyclase